MGREQLGGGARVIEGLGKRREEGERSREIDVGKK